MINKLTYDHVKNEIERSSKGNIILLSTEYVNNRTNLKFKCKICGNIFEMTYTNFMRQIRNKKDVCKCGNKDSEGINEIKRILLENNINFTIEKVYENCKDINHLKFDIHIPTKDILIEYDGEQHFTKMGFKNGDKKLKTTQKHDAMKNKYVLENKIKLLRIHWAHDSITELLNEFVLNDKSYSSFEERLKSYIEKYSPENISLEKGKRQMPDYKIQRPAARRPVIVKNIKTGIETELPSVTDAYLFIGTHGTLNVSNVCNGKLGSVNGYRCRYKDDVNCTKSIHYNDKYTTTNSKKIVVIDIFTLNRKTYDSATYASDDIGCNRSKISAVCNREQKRTGKYICYFADEVPDDISNDINTALHSYNFSMSNIIKRTSLKDGSISYFNNVGEACREMNIDYKKIGSSIRKAISESNRTAYGYKWEKIPKNSVKK